MLAWYDFIFKSSHKEDRRLDVSNDIFGRVVQSENDPFQVLDLGEDVIDHARYRGESVLENESSDPIHMLVRQVGSHRSS